MERTREVKVKDLRPGMNRVDVRVRVLEVKPTRTVQTRRGPRTLSEAVVGDETGRVKLTLWDRNAGKLVEGQAVLLKNAYVTSYRGEAQLNIGRYGSIQPVDDDSVVEADEVPEFTPRGGFQPFRRRRPRF